MANLFYQTAIQGALADANDTVVVKLPNYAADAWDQPALGSVFSTEFRVLEPMAATAKFTVSLRETDSGTVLETVSTADITNFTTLGELGFKTTVSSEVQYELVIAPVDGPSFSPALFEVLVDVIPQFGGTGDSFGANSGQEAAYFGAQNLGNFGTLDAITSYYLSVGAGENGVNETLDLTYTGPTATIAVTSLKSGQTNEYQITSGQTLPLTVSGASEVFQFEFKSPLATGEYSFDLASDTLGARVQSSPMVYIGTDYASSDYNNLTVTNSAAETTYQTPDVHLTIGQDIALSGLFDFSDDVTHVYLYGVGKTSGASPTVAFDLGVGAAKTLDPVTATVLTLDEFRAATVRYADLAQESITLIATGRRIDDALSQTIFDGFNQFDTSGFAKIDITPTATQINLSLNQASLAEGETGALSLQIDNFDFGSVTSDPQIRLISYSQDIKFANGETAITLPITDGTAQSIPVTARQDADVIAAEDVEIVAQIISNDPASAVLATIPLAPLTVTVTDLVPEISVQYNAATVLNSGEFGDSFIYTVTVENWDQVSSKFTDPNPGLFIKPELGASFEISPTDPNLPAPVTPGHYQITDGSITFRVSAKAGLSDTDKVVANLINKFFVSGKEIDLGSKYLDVKWVPTEFTDAITQSGTAQNDLFLANTIATTFNGLAGNDAMFVLGTNSMVGSHFDGGNGTDTIAFDEPLDTLAFGFNASFAPQIMLANDSSKFVSFTAVERAIFASTHYATKLTATGNNSGTSGADLFFVGASGSTVTDTTTGDNDIVVSRLSINTQKFTGIERFVLTGSENLNLDASSNAQAVTLQGNAANNRITGGQGNDTIIASTGVDSIDAGGGSADVVRFAGVRDSYNIYNFGAYYYVANASQPNLEITEITNVERFAFSDMTYTVSDLVLNDPTYDFAPHAGVSITMPSPPTEGEKPSAALGDGSSDYFFENTLFYGWIKNDTVEIGADIIDAVQPGDILKAAAVYLDLAGNLRVITSANASIGYIDDPATGRINLTKTGNQLTATLTEDFDDPDGISSANPPAFEFLVNDTVVASNTTGQYTLTGNDTVSVRYRYQDDFGTTSYLYGGDSALLSAPLTFSAGGNSRVSNQGLASNLSLADVTTRMGATNALKTAADLAMDRLSDRLGTSLSKMDIANLKIDLSQASQAASPIAFDGKSDDNIAFGLAIDATSVPNVEIRLDNVEFSIVTGAARILGGAGKNTVVADDNQQFIVLGEDDDDLFGGGGDDTIGSQGGDDIVDGGDDNDIVFGGTGNDTVKGGSGNDHVFDSWGNDTLDGDLGDDVIISFDGGDVINAGAGNDRILGGRFDDDIQGGAGNDQIHGDTLLSISRGADTLDGGAGHDWLMGGYGADTFVFNSGHDVIARFTQTTDGYTPTATGTDGGTDGGKLSIDVAGVDTFAQVQTLMSTQQGNTVIDFGATGSLTIWGIEHTEFTIDDFIF